MAAVAALAVVAAAARSSHAAAPYPVAPAVYAYPTPGSQFALARTQIAIRGIPIASLGPITVTGSKSGVHTGRLAPDSDGDGGSFVADRRFTPGERVTVTTPQNIVGGAAGAFQFEIAVTAGGIRSAPLMTVPAARGTVASYRSRPDLRPAAVRTLRNSRAATAGDIFVAPLDGPVQNGPMILDQSGGLLWFDPLTGRDSAADLRAQTYQGRPVLTWWQGNVNSGLGVGVGVIYDSSYRKIATVNAANGLHADLHEFLLTPQNTALVLSASLVRDDLRSVHGASSAAVVDGVIQEIDIPTGLMLYEWHSLDHVPYSASVTPAPKVKGKLYDYFHVNSVGQAPDGSLIVSARNTSAIYDLDARTGAVNWTLGGRLSSFKMGSNASFAFQHDARLQADGTITLFDDGAAPPVHKQSRALRLRLNFGAKTASWVAEDEHAPALLTGFAGNAQPLPGGGMFLGWGQQPYFTEFDAKGHELYDGRFVAATPSYRAYRMAWSGQPLTRPALAAGRARGGVTALYASWNGATTVASWQVLTGSSATALAPHGKPVTRKGFETAMSVHSSGPFFAVRALSSGGQALAQSVAVKGS